MNHSRIVILYLVRKLGWIGILCLMGLMVYLAFDVDEMQEWVLRAKIVKLAIFCGMVLMGLHWGQEQKLSKVLMLMDMRPQYAMQIMLGEAFGLWAFGTFFLGLACGVLVIGEAMVGPRMGPLYEVSSQAVEQKVEPDHYVLQWESSQHRQLGVRVAFMEGDRVSDVNYLQVKTNNGDSYMLKAMREVVLPVESPLILPRFMAGERALQMVVLEARLLQKTGSWGQSLLAWLLKSSIELFGLCVLLILLGKHVSLELGFVVILSIVFSQIVMSIYDEGEVARLLSQLSYLRKEGHSYGFEVRWWESWLLSWSKWVQGVLSLSISSPNGADLSVVKNGYTYSLTGHFWGILGAFVLGLGVSLGLDHWWKRFRAW